ncbi:hypothetical protein SBBP2_1320005 [Burkholderiales bacterium]|nr:hypothetical protein SBBP2_1320005 [Burkholderiales bacterium]
MLGSENTTKSSGDAKNESNVNVCWSYATRVRVAQQPAQQRDGSYEALAPLCLRKMIVRWSIALTNAPDSAKLRQQGLGLSAVTWVRCQHLRHSSSAPGSRSQDAQPF